ncbi:MAG: hypothetical protein Q8P24_21945, partial [Desulfobacterales bacterium]|nr:hypothetical protein [Desulfobacterales bacterium]
GIESHTSVGLGIDLRMESKKFTGFALSLDDQILHLCVFAKEDDRHDNGMTASMRRFSQRRRSRTY